MKYEVAIKILDKTYIDKLIVALARQGYDVYFNDNDECLVCFSATDDEVTAIKEAK